MDRFVVEATLGVGGVGFVYRVRHREIETVCALKVPHDRSAARVAQLRREARAQARVQHPNVAAVVDFVDAAPGPALVMEYVPGPTLEGLLRATRLPRFETDLLVPGLLAGVAAIHDAGLVHRDLKPGNVLLAPRGRMIVPKIVDFGLAQPTGDAPPLGPIATEDFGTPHYMAPEQLRDRAIADRRVDVYALGAILYEIVTGERLFASDDPVVVVEAASRGHIVPVRTLAPDLPERMARAIDGALASNPAYRWPTVEALWTAWAGPDAPSLDEAAKRSLGWRGVWLNTLTQLAPSAYDPSTASPPAIDPSRLEPPPSRWSVTLVAGATVVGILLIGVGSALATWFTPNIGGAPWAIADPVGPSTTRLTSPECDHEP